MLVPDCKKFTGYKPCKPYQDCRNCQNLYPCGTKIVIINLGAMGAVLMTTTVLPALKRKYPESTISWITEERCLPLLAHNPFIDYVLPFNFRSVLKVQAMEFDLICNVDKIAEACGLMNSLKSNKKLGFGLNANGAIIPLNKGSEYNYWLGLDDELKFKINTRTVPDMLREMFELDHQIDPYVVNLTPEEEKFSKEFKMQHRLISPIVGINTGSSPSFPHKRFSDEDILSMVEKLYAAQNGHPVILLGGLEDVDRNKMLTKKLGAKVINTPADEGLRKGLSYVKVCDVVITGDSLGMHMAIGLGKYVVARFNVTCASEIELYERGEKILSDSSCSPCWRQNCDDLRCKTEPYIEKICEAVQRILVQKDRL